MMQFSVVRDTQQHEISKGLTYFQQNEEFVDMTIAVDGHTIKVHKNVIALASPYLREILKSVPCSHPVLFLNGIKHDIFCSILEYIYMGAVLIPKNNMKHFMAVAQNLQICGLSNVPIPEETSAQNSQDINIPNTLPQYSIPKHSELQSTNLKEINSSNSILSKKLAKFPNTALNQFVTINIADANIDLPTTDIDNENPEVKFSPLDVECTNTNAGMKNTETILPYIEDQPMETTDFTLEQPPIHYNITFDTNGQSKINLVNDVIDIKEPLKLNVPSASCSDHQEDKTNNINNKVAVQKYTLSKRGKLQMILNRFIYSPHHKNKSGRRWRCIDYRRIGCTAFVDTNGDMIVARKNLHKHPVHDEIIKEKRQSNIFFTTLAHAEMARKEEEQIQQRAQDNLKTITKEINLNKPL